MTDDEREQMTRVIKGLALAIGRPSLCACAEQLRADGERIKALERLAEAADLIRVIIENSEGVWNCDFAVDANGEWHGEHCPWADFECVANFLAELQAARARQEGE